MAEPVRNYPKLALQILEQVGGEKNIVSATRCATRLRLVLRETPAGTKDKVAALKQQRRANGFHPSDSEPSNSEPSDSGCSNGFHPSDSDKNGVFTRQNLAGIRQ
mgnify:CR=1 FL=1